MLRRESRETLTVGTAVVDTARNEVGEFRAKERGEIYIRPLGGGREWSVSPEYVRRATRDERVKAGLETTNRRSSGSVPAGGAS